MRTLYDILGVRPHATQAELKAAWRRAAMKWHPDRNRGREHDAQREFQRINDAYAALTNPLRRAEYDLTLSAGLRRLSPEQPLARWQRFARDARRTWHRLLRGNVRSLLPHGGKRTRSLTRPQWLMGVSAAMLAAVLLADAAVDDTPLRSNFVSRQHAQHPATATMPATGSHAPEVPPAALNDDPALDEVHASLAEWRASEAAREDAHERDGKQTNERLSGSAGINIDPPAAVDGGTHTATRPAAGGVDAAGSDAAAPATASAGLSPDVAVANHPAAPAADPKGSAHAAPDKPVSASEHPVELSAKDAPARKIAVRASAPNRSTNTVQKAAPMRPHRVAAGTQSRSAPRSAGSGGAKAPLAGVVHHHPHRRNQDLSAPYGFSPGAWRYDGGAGS